ncbi:hypothetical protein Avbf_13495 [Armadillidium vulgare]|nr:hypothetical protein Avbf_13495 [Armadillidium vulgare]
MESMIETRDAMFQYVREEQSHREICLREVYSEAFKDRLKKQQYHDDAIAVDLKLVNRYIAEK